MKNKKKKHFRPRFLTLMLIASIIVAAGTSSLFYYKVIAAKSDFEKMAESSEDDSSSEDEGLKAKREEYQTKHDKSVAEGAIDFVSLVKGPDADESYSNIRNEDDAFEVLKKIQDFLGIKDANSEYRFEKKSSTDEYDYYTMQQYYEGYEVYGSRIVMMVNMAGEIVGTSGNYISIEEDEIDFNVKLSDSDALEKANKLLGITQGCGTVLNMQGLKIYPTASGSVVPAYFIEKNVEETGVTVGVVAVDANEGKIVLEHNNFIEEPEVGNDPNVISDEDEASNNETSQEEEEFVNSVEVDGAQVWNSENNIYEVYDAKRNIGVYRTEVKNLTMIGEDMISQGQVSLVRWEDGKDTKPTREIAILGKASKVYDYYFERLSRIGIKSENGYAQQLYVVADVQKLAGNAAISKNACWTGDQTILIGNQYSSSLEVLSHEYTHGVTSEVSSLLMGDTRQTSQQMAISEGLSDIFAILVCDWNNGKADNDYDWVRDNGRNIADPKGSRGTACLDDVKDFTDNTDCHYASTLISHPAYLMTTGITTFGMEISPQKLAKLWYEAMHRMTAQTDFKQMRRLVEEDAIHMNNVDELTDLQLECVIDSFDRVGIENSYDYSLTKNSTIKVYDKDNELYDNYKLTINKRYGDEVKTIEVDQKTYTLKLEPGVYEFVFTDLANEDNYTDIITVVINDNDDDEAKVEPYKQVGEFFTNFGVDERQVALVLDVSGSMDGTPMSETKDAAIKFVDTVFKESPGSKISVITYSSSSTVVIESSSNKTEVQNAIRNISSYGGTNMHGGISTAYEILKKNKSDKSLLVVMSDGLPNEGETLDDSYDEAVVSLASTIKNENIYIYAMGFFHNLQGEELQSGTNLMSRIATPGYSYNVTDTDSIQYVFSGVAYEVSGQRNILIRIECPVDVTVTYDGETLSSDDDNRNTFTSFGMLSFEGENDETKVLKLKCDEAYEICVNGYDKGKMDYTICYPDEDGEYEDEIEFKNIPITKKSVIAMNTTIDSAQQQVLKVDSDGDGKFEKTYMSDEDGKVVEKSEIEKKYRIIALVVLIIIILLLVTLKIVSVIKKIKNNKICTSCGKTIKRKATFCNACGAAHTKQRVFLPEKIERKPQSSFAIIVKVALIVVFVCEATAAYTAYNSAATNVYLQLKEGQIVSAQMMYDNAVKSSSLEKKYLTRLTEPFVKEVDQALTTKVISKETAATYMNAIADMKLGDASKQAKDYYKSYGVKINKKTDEENDDESSEKVNE